MWVTRHNPLDWTPALVVKCGVPRYNPHPVRILRNLYNVNTGSFRLHHIVHHWPITSTEYAKRKGMKAGIIIGPRYAFSSPFRSRRSFLLHSKHWRQWKCETEYLTKWSFFSRSGLHGDSTMRSCWMPTNLTTIGVGDIGEIINRRSG